MDYGLSNILGTNTLTSLYRLGGASVKNSGISFMDLASAPAALEKTFSNIGNLLKTRIISAPAITPEVSLSAETNMFFLNM